MWFLDLGVKMKRRFNYTGRKRIPREKAPVSVEKDRHGLIKSFTATFDLGELGLPLDAEIFIEIYHSTERQRYPYGTVGNIRPPDNTSLSGLGYKGNLKYRVLVVDNGGKLLAAGFRLKLDPAAKKGLLNVYYEDLGKRIWKLEYGEENGAPELYLNNKISPDIRAIALTPEFIFHIYPAVLRDILIHIIFVDRPEDWNLEDWNEDDSEWQKKWLGFAGAIVLGEDLPESIMAEAPDSDEVNE